MRPSKQQSAIVVAALVAATYGAARLSVPHSVTVDRAGDVCVEVWTYGTLLGYHTSGRPCQPTMFPVDCVNPGGGVLPYIQVEVEACVPS
jgi:hypothetical protein